jgi:hypothetical protein
MTGPQPPSQSLMASGDGPTLWSYQLTLNPHEPECPGTPARGLAERQTWGWARTVSDAAESIWVSAQ